MRLKDYRGFDLEHLKVVLPGTDTAIPYYDAPGWVDELQVLKIENGVIYLD